MELTSEDISRWIGSLGKASLETMCSRVAERVVHQEIVDPVRQNLLASVLSAALSYSDWIGPRTASFERLSTIALTPFAGQQSGPAAEHISFVARVLRNEYAAQQVIRMRDPYFDQHGPGEDARCH